MEVIKKTFTQIKKIPHGIRKRILVVLGLLCLLNILVWVSGIIVSRSDATIIGLLILAYGFGLRHAVDADHIAAIDNTTRKLVHERKTPVTVGLFFSLGHSTIVILLSLLIAIGSSFMKHTLPSLQSIGLLLGTTISSIFLLIIGVINFVAFINILRKFRRVTKGNHDLMQSNNFIISGPMQKIFNTLLRSVTASWQMYFIGFLFGLGFDTATEVGILSITSLTSASGISFFTIMLLPLAFTAGMTLIDTADGMLMLGAYGWAYVKPERKLYYNLHITLLSVIIALGIGTMQILSLFSASQFSHSEFFRFRALTDLPYAGYGIIAVFLVSWIVSYGIYKYKK